ncbi:CRISPR type I-E-associated protein CasA/Cse1 [Catenulispora sp. EB89]|uniref:type I-E CRISPR-associated protein Cse1/CasA n=1 Tax=Catenulispora sp. EB89 TaxID=3156257 RepID=UPI003519D4FC
MSDVDGGHRAAVDVALWGKSRNLPSPYPLVWHLLDAAAMAELLWEEYLTPSQRRVILDGLGLGTAQESSGRALLAFWAGLHDLGKISPGFQRADADRFAELLASGYSSAADSDYRHDWVSQQSVAFQLAGAGYGSPWSRGRPGSCPAQRVAQVLGGHHGRFSEAVRWPVAQTTVPEVFPGLGSGLWEQQRAEHFEAIKALLSVEPPSRVYPEAAALVAGTVIIADWLVSGEEFLRRRLKEAGESGGGQQSLRAHLVASRQVVPELLATSGLTRPRIRQYGFAAAFPGIAQPNDLQCGIEAALPSAARGAGILVVTAPMGVGKTETALFAASVMGRAAGAAGLHFALPTMATADQMFDRLLGYAEHNLEEPATLALVHGMADLNERYDPTTQESATERVLSEDDRGGPGRVALASQWLRGNKRGMLAPISVGTIDQVLLSVLPTRHNVLRLTGLTGKVLVVDEAHAYDAYQQALLRRVLAWLGACGAPVVLLSATLPGSVSKSLVRAWWQGACPDGRPPAFDLPYPGWVHIDAETRAVTGGQVEVPTVELTVSAQPYRVGGAAEPVEDLARIGEVLAPMARIGGCALVLRNTVASAQQTFAEIRELVSSWPAERRPEVHLLHARFPLWQRQQITSDLEAKFGRPRSEAPGARPKSAIVVATQVAEQSLDFDFDVVVSDLAPVAQLLQRSGRGHRHRRPAEERGAFPVPGLVVLVPVNAAGELEAPIADGLIYGDDLLGHTTEALFGSKRVDAGQVKVVKIPDDVQDLVERVYRGFDGTDDAAIQQAALARLGADQAAAGEAATRMIPAPADMQDLYEFSRSYLPDEHALTRLDADSVQMLCCFVDAAGRRWLDPGCTETLPEVGLGYRGRPSRAQVRQVRRWCIPVRRGAWAKDLGPENVPPVCWADDPHLAGVVLLPHRLDGAKPRPVSVGTVSFLLDTDSGLLRSQPGRGGRTVAEPSYGGVGGRGAPGFDLLTQPWIPVRETGGQTREVGLLELFERAHEIQDLAVPVPPAQSGLWRILYAITARITGLDRPAGRVEAWQDRRDEALDAGRFKIEDITGYFKTYADRFDVFDAERPWLQDPRLARQCEKSSGVNRLVLSRTSGNNQVWFDHNIDADPQPLRTAEAVWHLIAQMYYGPAGRCTARKAGEVNAADTKAGPLRRAVSYHQIGTSLFQSLLVNILPSKGVDLDQDELGCPWEQPELPDALALPSRPARFTELLTTRGRHALLLRPAADAKGGIDTGHVAQAYLTWGVRGEAVPADDPYLAYVTVKEARFPHSTTAERALWRDLDALLGYRSHQDTAKGRLVDQPAAMEHSATSLPPDVHGQLRIRALGFDQDGKTTDRQWFTADTPAGVLRWAVQQNPQATEQIAKLRAAADNAAWQLKTAIGTAWETTGARSDDQLWQQTAAVMYWPAAEQAFWRAVREGDTVAPLRRFRLVALDAYDRTTRANRSTRPQTIYAVELGRARFFPKPQAAAARKRTSTLTAQTAPGPNTAAANLFVQQVRIRCGDNGARAALRRSKAQTRRYRLGEAVFGVVEASMAAVEQHQGRQSPAGIDVGDWQLACYTIAAIVAEEEHVRRSAGPDDDPDSDAVSGHDAAPETAEPREDLVAEASEPAQAANRKPLAARPLPLAAVLGLAVAAGDLNRDSTTDQIHALARTSAAGLRQRLPSITDRLITVGRRPDWAALLLDLARWDRHRAEIATRWLHTYHRAALSSDNPDPNQDTDSTLEKDSDPT